MSQLGERPITSSCSLFWQMLNRNDKSQDTCISWYLIRYLHYIWAFEVIWRENLQFKLVWNMALISASLGLVLIVNQVRNHIRLSNIDQEAVPYDDGSLELSECAVSLA